MTTRTLSRICEPRCLLRGAAVGFVLPLVLGGLPRSLDGAGIPDNHPAPDDTRSTPAEHELRVRSILRAEGDSQAARAEIVPERRGTAMDKWWADLLDRRIGASAAGYAWVVMRSGQILSEGGAGWARAGSNRTRGERMRPTTRMQIASASKPITAMAVALALAEHGISIDTPMVSLIQDLPPELGERIAAVTVRQLLTHRSGYRFGYVPSPRIEETRRLLATPVSNPPGDIVRYSNINYSLARAVLEGLTGEAYPSFVARRLFSPAGVHQASLTPGPADAFAHRFLTSPHGTALALDFTDEGGAYGWYMSARELGHWGDALVRGDLLPPPVLSAALADGLGWNRVNAPGGPAFRHDGQWVLPDNSGVRTSIVLWPDSIVAVLFVNTNVPFGPGEVLVDGLRRLTPTFAQATDRESGRVIVHISAPEAATVLRFATDGSSPTSRSSRRYVGPVELEAPATIRAVGMRGQRVASLPASLTISPIH